jgi:hypothetical protein
MSKIRCLPNGFVRIRNIDRLDYVELSPAEVREISEEQDLRYAINDVEFHLAESEEYRSGDEESGEYRYDTSKFTPEVLRSLAAEVLDRRDNETTVQEAYWEICENVIENFSKEERDNQ